MKIQYVDRETGLECSEIVYGGAALRWLYSDQATASQSSIVGKSIAILSSYFKKSVRWLITQKIASAVYGFIQKSRLSRRKVEPFIKKFDIQRHEFLEPVNGYNSFNDFFIRRIRSECRPVNQDLKTVVCPADGRYQVYPDLTKPIELAIKGVKLSPASLFQACGLDFMHDNYSLVKIRLCPVDYHRYHFPFDCMVSEPKIKKGPLYSVNPLALSKDPDILLKNHRIISFLKSDQFGEVIFIEVGATFVGSIHQTYTPHQMQYKGKEKGYFSFGGSMLLMIFKKDAIAFDSIFIEASKKGLEVYSKMGLSLARAK